MAERASFKKRWWLNFGIILGVMVATVVGVYFLSSDLAAQEAKIVSDKNLLAEQTAVVGKLASLKSDAAKAGPYLAAMQKLLPTHDQLIGFPQWVSAIATSHSVTASVSFSGRSIPATATLPGSDGFSLNVSGSSANIVAFLDDLETKSPGYLLTITSFNLSNQGNSYSLTAQGQVFSRGT